jgi:hypothetical protein
MERVGDEIERELARSGSRDAVPLAVVTRAWPAAVGDAIARRAWPLRISRDGTLHVAAASATWAHELDLLQNDILEALRAQVGDAAPAKVRFAVGPIPEPPAPLESSASVAADPEELPPEIEAEASAAAAVIDDPELRALAARAARTSLLRARSGR